MLKTIITSAVTAIIIAVLAISFGGPKTAPELGSFIETVPIQFGAGFKLGGSGVVPVGNIIKKEIVGICNAATTELPLEATSTDDFTCTVTGARSGDNVQVFLPSSSGSVYGGFTISHTVASTNTITFGIVNLTGAATSSFPLASTSVQYRVTDF